MYKDIPIAELYYVGQKTQDKATAIDFIPHTKDNLENIGARLILSPVKDLVFLFNGIYQYQNKTTTDIDNHLRNAWLGAVAAQYSFTKLPWSPVLSVDVGMASDKWDVMYCDVTTAPIMSALIANTDGITAGTTLSVRPVSDIGVKMRYLNAHLYKANTPIYNDYAYYVMTDNRDIGNELDVSTTYDYTEDVQLGLDGGVFMPGRAFAESNRHNASQAIGKVKVSF
jgi:hypothetical protein